MFLSIWSTVIDELALQSIPTVTVCVIVSRTREKFVYFA